MAVSLWTNEKQNTINQSGNASKNSPSNSKKSVDELVNSTLSALDSSGTRVSYDNNTEEGKNNRADAWLQANALASEAVANGNRFGKNEYNRLVDNYYNQITGDNTAASYVRSEGDDVFRRMNNGLSLLDEGVGSIVDGLFDNTVGNLVGLFNEDAGNSVKNFMTADEAGNLATMLGLMAIPGAGVPLAVAKAAIQSEDEIKNAINGVDSYSGLDLTDDERQANALSAALDVGLTAVPLLGKAGTGIKNAILKQAGRETGSGIASSAGAAKKEGLEKLSKDIEKSSEKLADAQKATKEAEQAYRTDLILTDEVINEVPKESTYFSNAIKKSGAKTGNDIPLIENGNYITIPGNSQIPAASRGGIGSQRSAAIKAEEAKAKEVQSWKEEIKKSEKKLEKARKAEQEILDRNLKQKAYLDVNSNPVETEKVVRDIIEKNGGTVTNGGIYDNFLNDIESGKGILSSAMRAITGSGKPLYAGATDGEAVAKEIARKISNGEKITEDEIKFFSDNGLLRYISNEPVKESAEKVAETSAKGIAGKLSEAANKAKDKVTKSDKYGKKPGSLIGTGLAARGLLGGGAGALNGATNSPGDGTALVSGGIEGALMGMIAPKLMSNSRGAASRLVGPTRKDVLNSAALGAALSGNSHATSGYNGSTQSEQELYSIVQAIQNLYNMNTESEE